jgi:hypothetical protein
MQGQLLRMIDLLSLLRLGLALVLLAALFAWKVDPLAAQDQSGITSPSPGAAVGGDVPIFGTAVIDPFQKYELHYKQEPSGDDAYIYFGGGTNQVINGQLGVWQAGGLPPGAYSIRLRVVKADGNYAEFYAPNVNLNVNQDPLIPEPTPTSDEPTVTPIPTETFTPAPQPTAAVGAVQQPQVEGSQPAEPTPTPIVVAAGEEAPTPTAEVLAANPIGGAPASAAVSQVNTDASLTRELGEAVSFDRLRNQFWNGVRYSMVLCLGVLALFGGKRLFDWVWTQFR